MLIKLDDRTFINPKDVVSASIIAGRWIEIVMSDSAKHALKAGYGKDLYETLDNFVKKINEACA